VKVKVVGEVEVVGKSCRSEWLTFHHYSLFIINYSLDPCCRGEEAGEVGFVEGDDCGR
jgi:hypothetical protein